MIDLLVDEVSSQLNDHLRLKGMDDLYKCTVGDVTVHDKNNEAGGDNEIVESIILSLVSVEEENALKNNYPLRKVGSSFLQEKSSVYINVYLLFAAKYNNYDTALKALSQVITCFQTIRRVFFVFDNETQESVLNLHNMGFENLNNLWTVLGGRYLPSVIYKARVLMFQQSPPVSGSAIVDIQEQEAIP
ncbi:DUF4255 domain-containing protein [Chryseolinea soli]|uniref:DUF4255 domain-containing protein n=1 Tax=Chryseolinea soli TaxID=2321403 RepID=A0A385STW4_9BACT|nr:DUF4255 domain-containing protein [Chryseolinea soli]AYB33986.1 DUF4255 domain-containing protein [Chryseolinea soli]